MYTFRKTHIGVKPDKVAELTKSLAETGRIRHIWLADKPPLYPSVYVAHRVERLLKEQILEVRRKRSFTRLVADAGGEVAPKTPSTTKKLLQRTPPSPTVIGFTPRPTYFLPKHSPLRDAVKKGGVLSRLRLAFPLLPTKGLALAEQARSDVVAIATPVNEEEKKPVDATLTPAEEAFDHVYETEVREPRDRRMPPFSGPGRLMLWTVADLQQPVGQYFQGPQWREGANGQHMWAAILAQTTVNMLSDQFGIKAWADPTFSGLWVTRLRPDGASDGPDRQIASIWPHVDEETDIVSACMTLNVASPKEIQVLTEEGEKANSSQAAAGGENNSDNKTAEHVDLNSDDTVTDIASELATRPLGYNPKHRLTWADIVRLGKVMPVRKLGTISSSYSPGGPVWYTRAFEGRQKKTGADLELCAPVGMDNYSISVAWSQELARILGYPSPKVDHLHNNGWSTLEAPQGPGFMALESDWSWTGFDSNKARPSSQRLPIRPRLRSELTKDPETNELIFEKTLGRLLRDLQTSVGGQRLDPREPDNHKKKKKKKEEEDTTTTSTSSSFRELESVSSVY